MSFVIPTGSEVLTTLWPFGVTRIIVVVGHCCRGRNGKNCSDKGLELGRESTKWTMRMRWRRKMEKSELHDINSWPGSYLGECILREGSAGTNTVAVEVEGRLYVP